MSSYREPTYQSQAWSTQLDYKYIDITKGQQILALGKPNEDILAVTRGLSVPLMLVVLRSQ
jgi:hypothetical protein